MALLLSLRPTSSTERKNAVGEGLLVQNGNEPKIQELIIQKSEHKFKKKSNTFLNILW